MIDEEDDDIGVYGFQVHYRTREKSLLFSSCSSLCLCLSVRLSSFINTANPSRILVKVYTGNFRKIWLGTPNLVTIRPQYWALYVKTRVYSHILFYRMRKLGSNFLTCVGRERRLLASSCLSVRQSVRPHKTARLSLDKFSWNLELGTFMKIRQESS